MTRRPAIALTITTALAVAAALGLTSRPRSAAPAAEPFSTPPPSPASTPKSTLCISGPGNAASALADHVDVAALPDLARRAFAAERLAERAGHSPAFPQRMGANITLPPPICVPR